MAPTYTNTSRLKFRIPQANQKVNDFTAIIDALGNDIDAGTPGWASGLGSALPAAGTRGRFYDETDTGVLRFDGGDRWRALDTLLAARAYRNTALTIPGSGSWSVIQLDAASFDGESAFSSSLYGAYTCKRPGAYLVACGVSYVLGNNPQVIQAAVFKNNVLAVTSHIQTIRGGTAGDQIGAVATDILNCATGDNLTLQAFNNGGNSCGLILASENNYLAVRPLC